jgi:hypothetical protein
MTIRRHKPKHASTPPVAPAAAGTPPARRAPEPDREWQPGELITPAAAADRLAGRAVLALRERGDLLWPPIYQRVEIAAAMASGHVALETQPDGAAARELAALWVAVRAALHATPVRRHVDRTRIPVLAIAARPRT